MSAEETLVNSESEEDSEEEEESGSDIDDCSPQDLAQFMISSPDNLQALADLMPRSMSEVLDQMGDALLEPRGVDELEVVLRDERHQLTSEERELLRGSIRLMWDREAREKFFEEMKGRRRAI